MHATCHLLTYEGVLNPYPPREMDDEWTNSPSSMGSKLTMDGQRQPILIGKHGIGEYNIDLISIFNLALTSVYER